MSYLNLKQQYKDDLFWKDLFKTCLIAGILEASVSRCFCHFESVLAVVCKKHGLLETIFAIKDLLTLFTYLSRFVTICFQLT